MLKIEASALFQGQNSHLKTYRGKGICHECQHPLLRSVPGRYIIPRHLLTLSSELKSRFTPAQPSFITQSPRGFKYLYNVRSRGSKGMKNCPNFQNARARARVNKTATYPSSSCLKNVHSSACNRLYIPVSGGILCLRQEKRML